MRVLVIGSDTPVGKSLQEFLLRRGREVVTLATADCRWKSERQTKKAVVRAACDFVADTRIQASADSGEPIHDIDLKRTLWLAWACDKNDMIYVYLSTSRVFAGDRGRLYREDDLPDNEESLGLLLQQAESSITDQCEQHVILRLGPVFSHRGINVLTHMLRQLMAGGTVLLEDHSRGAPVEAGDAARVVSALLDQFSTGASAWGVYHYCSADSTNCYEFAEVLLASASQFSDFPGGVVELARPEVQKPRLNRSLDCSRLRSTFAIKQNPWRRFIADTVKRHFESAIPLEK
jgi:dTDP-4-dehydrorhamnose reductase